MLVGGDQINGGTITSDVVEGGLVDTDDMNAPYVPISTLKSGRNSSLMK